VVSSGWSALGNTFLMSLSISISSMERSQLSLSARGPSSYGTMFFILFLKGSLWELSIFLKGGFLSPPTFE
jgi:hypothetical protein